MSLGVLNNISAIYAQTNLNQTQSSLQNTLTQLSSGSKINSGADDAAGLALADGLHANVAALTQSTQNATAGVGLLQTADGALSQVTNLLNRAVTLATEAANGTLNSSQVSSANQEYQNILSEIGNIGSTTNFNGNSQRQSSSATAHRPAPPRSTKSLERSAPAAWEHQLLRRQRRRRSLTQRQPPLRSPPVRPQPLHSLQRPTPSLAR